MANKARYQYDTSPRKIEPEYKKKTKKNIVKKEVTKISLDKKQNNKLKTKTILYVVVAFSVFFAVCYRNAQINENFAVVKKLNKEFATVQKENEQLRIEIEHNLNLQTVEQSAKELLGMQKLNNNQKSYINLPKSDYIEAAPEKIIKNEKKSWIDNILNLLNIKND